MSRTRILLFLMILYGAASLLHFIHNGLYIHAYPNPPTWITPLGVYASWCGIAAVGVLGYWLYRKVSPAIGHLRRGRSRCAPASLHRAFHAAWYVKRRA
jgi:hypothetical protein